ncbi:DNA dependent RNA polymerase [Pelagibacter phage Eyrgjafa EXVC018P]|uniref:DNA-directed RNA polymerase n=1 Tax=Pelagibacter phage Eyrgjafa EXVC018P TaxID=2736227 RepID=A0A7S6C6C1_9CAUD|nr:DNA dependent RNA polymerase [Pelagibacter phage Eyrgjafa EXVC018P]QLF88205.1 DNA dependent RNA polymerase [Pelagibacter phage Gjalp EXVC020P]
MHYNFIKQTNKRYLEELNNRWHEFPVVWNSVNIMQKTEWAINKPVYDVLLKCSQESYPLGKLPINPEDIPLPPKPFDIAINKDAKSKWKREASTVYKERAKMKSKYIQVVKILEEAKDFLEKGFWYSYQLDFRGRIYPKATLMSPQSADYSRALLKFRFGKPIANEEAFNNFAVAGAGLYGETDKEELPVRRQWVIDNADKIISTANNPLTDTFWSTADKPFSFLAWCFEYRDFALTDFDPSFITTLPIHSDCSNSGLQHYSAMMRDEVGGKATNLIPSNKPNDVYGIVADKVKEKLALSTEPLAKQWLDYGIDRKICKKPVMCLPYSLTQYSCRQYIEDHVHKELVENNKRHEFGDDLFKSTQWLTKVVWESINDVIIGAKEIMQFLKDVAKLVSSENLPVAWTSPLGLPIFMSVYKKESKRVKTKMGDSIIKLSVTSDTNEIDRRKTQQSICPNLIHQLDSSVLSLAVVKGSEIGIDNFSLIHDSFGVLAPDVDKMSLALREAFCEIYSKDVLANWAMEMKQILSEKNKKKFPNLPAKGNLDLELVKSSVFFCV